MKERGRMVKGALAVLSTILATIPPRILPRILKEHAGTGPTGTARP